MEQTKNENWTRKLRGKDISSHRSEISTLQKKKEVIAHRLMRKLLNLQVELEILKVKGNEMIQGIFDLTVLSRDNVGKKHFEFTCYDGSVMIKRNMNTKYIFDEGLKKQANTTIETHIVNGLILEEHIVELLDEFVALKDDEPTTVIKKLVPILGKLGTKNEKILDILISIELSTVEEVEDPVYRVYLRNEGSGEMELIQTSLSKV